MCQIEVLWWKWVYYSTEKVKMSGGNFISELKFYAVLVLGYQKAHLYLIRTFSLIYL